MTTETRLLKAVATLKSVQADLQRLAADHPDPTARPVFERQARSVESMLGRLEDRLRAVRAEEPEYAGRSR